MLVGGWNGERQRFNRTVAHAQAGMLLLAAAALILPAVFQLVHGHGLPQVSEERHSFGSDVEHLSLAVAIVLIVSYLAGLWFSLRTHRDLFNVWVEHEGPPDERAWSVRKSVVVLAIAGVLVGVMSEILVGSIEKASSDIGPTPFFVGVVVGAVGGHAAQHY